MNFSAILDAIAKPAPAEDEPFRAPGQRASLEFWQVLDQIADAPPISDERLKDAYFAEGSIAASRLAEADEAEMSLDPEDIAFELDLFAVLSLEELSILRRRFAMLNHPDRRPAHLREQANTRMTIANTLIDAASVRFKG